MNHIQGYSPDNPGGSFNMERLTPQFRRLCIGIGYFLKRTDQWLLWEEVVNEHGYERVCAALRRCEPNEQGFKSYNHAVKLCRVIRGEEAAAERQALQDADNAKLKEKAKGKGRLVRVDGNWIVEVKSEAP